MNEFFTNIDDIPQTLFTVQINSIELQNLLSKIITSIQTLKDENVELRTRLTDLEHVLYPNGVHNKGMGEAFEDLFEKMLRLENIIDAKGSPSPNRERGDGNARISRFHREPVHSGGVTSRLERLEKEMHLIHKDDLSTLREHNKGLWDLTKQLESALNELNRRTLENFYQTDVQAESNRVDIDMKFAEVFDAVSHIESQLNEAGRILSLSNTSVLDRYMPLISETNERVRSGLIAQK